MGRAAANGGQAVTDLPQAAAAAAAQALRHPPDGAGMTMAEWDHARAIAAIDAAAPHLHAAWLATVIGYRIDGRIYHPADVTIIRRDVPCFEPDLTEAEAETLKERFREAQRNGMITILADDTYQRIAEAVAAERERTLALLASEAERLRTANFSESDAIAAGALEDFADLIRKETPDAT
jgi:hypothetical protein